MDKCLWGNKIALLQNACLASLSTCAEGVQFYCPSCTYLAILNCTIFTYFGHCVHAYQNTRTMYIRWAFSAHFFQNFCTIFMCTTGNFFQTFHSFKVEMRIKVFEYFNAIYFTRAPNTKQVQSNEKSEFLINRKAKNRCFFTVIFYSIFKSMTL